MNRKLIFYGAISVDGYLARKDHSLDWLIGTEGEQDTDYADFFDSVDIVLMGRSTYEQILMLFPDEFPYQEKQCYVFSRTLIGSNEYVRFINEDIVKFTQSLKEQIGKKIWIVGGGEVLQPLLQAELIDEFIMQIVPHLLGQGIPLFKQFNQEQTLDLIDVRRYKQIAELRFETK